MKAKYTGITDYVLTNGKIYEIVDSGTGVSILRDGTELTTASNHYFKENFEEVLPYTAVCKIKEKGLGFTFGKEYKFSINTSEIPYSMINDDGYAALLPTSAFHNIFDVVDENVFNDDQDMPEFMVFVQNGQSPRHIHDSIDKAEAEARRLAEMSSNIGKMVYVVEIKKMFKSKIVVEEQEA